jgi:hypothetical protein
MFKLMDQSPLRFIPPQSNFLSPAAVSYGGTQGSFDLRVFLVCSEKQLAKYITSILLLR